MNKVLSSCRFLSVVALSWAVFFLISVLIDRISYSAGISIYYQMMLVKSVLLVSLIAVAMVLSDSRWWRNIRSLDVVVVLAFAVASALVYAWHFQKLEGELASPTIRNVSPTSVIQGDTIVIDGHGFGQPIAAGSVSIGHLGLRVMGWSDRKIEAEVPVPDRFFKGLLTITRGDGEESNGVPVQVADPDIVLK